MNQGPSAESRTGRVCVVGSLNLDHISRVPALPAPGQTVAASELLFRHGGKGANQAYAARRQGSVVSLIGALGQDSAGAAYRLRLSEAGIGTEHLKETPGPTGSAFIHLDPSGENTIVVAAGANGLLTPADIALARPAIEAAAVLLVQLEVPAEAVVAAIRIANQAGVRVVFNPSPFDPDFPWREVFIDVLVVNEGEADQLDDSIPPGEELRMENLVITHGDKPTDLITPDGDFSLRPPKVVPVDTVGAGDAFAGTLAARLALGEPLHRAVTLANAAGALATLKIGAQEAMPDAAATEAALK